MKYEVTIEKRAYFSFEVDVDSIENIEDAIGDITDRSNEACLSERDYNYDFTVHDENGNIVIGWTEWRNNK